MPPAHPPPLACPPAVFHVQAQNDANTSHGEAVLKMVSGPSVISIGADQTIDLENLDSCLDVRFELDKSQSSVFSANPLSGDSEFGPRTNYADSDQKIRSFTFRYNNTVHKFFDNPFHKYSLNLLDYSAVPFPANYVIDPKVENRPPNQGFSFYLILAFLIGGAEFALAVVAAQLSKSFSRE